jgi:hypothetical protein
VPEGDAINCLEGKGDTCAKAFAQQKTRKTKLHRYFILLTPAPARL